MKPPNGFREGPRMAYRPIICMIGLDESSPVFHNHFRFRQVPITEAETRQDQRDKHEAETETAARP